MDTPVKFLNIEPIAKLYFFTEVSLVLSAFGLGHSFLMLRSGSRDEYLR